MLGRSAAFLAALLLAAASGAEPYAVGSVVASLTLPDQRGKPHALDESVRLVLFSRDMDGGRVIREVLKEGGGALLERHRAVYVADVSRMPGLIRRVIAKPRMRRRPYPVLLDEEGSLTADFPGAEGKATLIFLERLRVTRIENAGSSDELRSALSPPAPGNQRP